MTEKEATEVAVGVSAHSVTLSMIEGDQWATLSMTPTHARFLAAQLRAAADALDPPVSPHVGHEG